MWNQTKPLHFDREITSRFFCFKTFWLRRRGKLLSLSCRWVACICKVIGEFGSRGGGDLASSMRCLTFT